MSRILWISLPLGVVIGLVFFRQYRVYKWGKCRSKKTLKGKVVIITGANSGIGKATAIELAKRDARIILACRDFTKVTSAVEEIRKVTDKGELVPRRLDLASIKSVKNFVEDFEKTEGKLHVLINNAGVFQCPYTRTEDGFEMQMGVNHLGHFLLTILLLNTLKKSAPSRVIVVTSMLSKRGQIDLAKLNPNEKEYNKGAAYCNSKMANCLFAQELQKKVEGTGVNVYTVSPGHVWTNLGRHLKIPYWSMALLLPAAYLFVRTPSQGCQTIVHCAVEEELEDESGKFYRDCQEQPWPPNILLNSHIAPKLWELSEKLTGCPKT